VKSGKFPGLALAFLCAIVPSGGAQMSPAKVAALESNLQHVKAAYNRLPANKKLLLDGASNVVQFADFWHRTGMRFADPAFAAARVQRVSARPAATSATTNKIIPISATGLFQDLSGSTLAGFTQSESSTARCGNNVVVGFNDSGGIFETPLFLTGAGGESLAGFAYSTDGGHTFTDGGPVDPGPNFGSLLGGDPVLSCSNPSTFYYSQLFLFSDAAGNPVTAVAVNKSTDGGHSFGEPVVVIGKDGLSHFLDKPWSAVDPSNPKNIYVSYTDFDGSGTSKACGKLMRTAIEFVVSHDAGATWSAPKVASEVCDNEAVSGSQVALDSKGTMHIAWIDLGPTFPEGNRTIFQSIYAGGVLLPPVTVDIIQPGGDAFLLQGAFRDFLGMAMAVDHSRTGSDGMVYITWADGRNKRLPDPVASQGVYGYDDILLRVSFDDGSHFGFFSQVNSDFQSRLGPGHDHYQPGIAIDKTGTIGICWYDRRNDPENFSVGRFCATSNNNGITFTNINTNLAPYTPAHGNDEILNPVYMGDYDQPASDSLNQEAGFFGAFEAQGNRGNPNVVGFEF